VQISDEALLVGDTVIPVGSGWHGQPNAPGSQFVPYAVLIALTATISTGSIPDPQGDVVLPYSVQSFGVLPEQAQYVADRTREALAGMRGLVLDLGPRYKIDQVRSDSLGGVNKVAETNSAFFGIQDGVSLSLRKQRGA
jgi:hypothetical protein